jgi:aryl-alcohol dehydrogenase-like predicted oxidoreductase
MEQRRLGASGIEVGAVGIGTQQWGSKSWGYGKSYTRDDHEATYQTLLDAGVNLFDTSEDYGGGLAEQFIGEFHRADGRPIFLATKFTPSKIYDPSTRVSAKSMMSTLDGSLKRLGVRAVDLYQLHYPLARRRLGSYLDTLAETVKVGKARAIGVSNFNAELLRYAHEHLAGRGVALASNQIEYSLLYRHPEHNGMLAACEELDIALIAILPLGEGVLSGKYRVGGKPYPSRVRNILTVTNWDLFHEDENAESILRRVRRKPYELQREALEPLFDLLESIATAHNATIAQVALNWLLASNPRVIPIPGAKYARQARDNASALGWKLSPGEFERISEREAAIRASLGRS